jgi:hypothetical protein
VGLVDEELGRIREQIDEAEGDFRRAQEDFDSLLSGADDDDDADGDTGERLTSGMPQTSGFRTAWMRSTCSVTPRMNCGVPLRNSRTQVQARAIATA